MLVDVVVVETGAGGKLLEDALAHDGVADAQSVVEATAVRDGPQRVSEGERRGNPFPKLVIWVGSHVPVPNERRVGTGLRSLLVQLIVDAGTVGRFEQAGAGHRPHVRPCVVHVDVADSVPVGKLLEDGLAHAGVSDPQFVVEPLAEGDGSQRLLEGEVRVHPRAQLADAVVVLVPVPHGLLSGCRRRVKLQGALDGLLGHEGVDDAPAFLDGPVMELLLYLANHRVDDCLDLTSTPAVPREARPAGPVDGLQDVVAHPANLAEGLTVTLRLGGLARLYKVRKPVKEIFDAATVVTDGLLDGILDIHTVIKLPVLAVT